jgi:hypothetical protein
MLYSKRHEAGDEKFDTNVPSVLFLSGVAIVMTLTANGLIGMGLWSLFGEQKTVMAPDVWANMAFLGAALVGAALIDVQALLVMFGMAPRLTSKAADESPNALVDLFSLHSWENTVTGITIAVNWLAAHGLATSALKMGMENPITPVKMSAETLHDLATGDVLLNPLLRAWNWEAVYGMTCGLHIGTYFAVSGAHRARFNVRKLAPVAICYGVLAIFLMTLAGFFRRRQYTDGWMGPSDGFWLVLCHLTGLYLAYDQWYKTHPTSETDTGAALEFQEGIRAFADEWRGWKPLTVFMLTTFLSVVFAYATPIYPIVLVITYAFHCKSHPMNRGWNKILLFLTITHQVLHYFVHSYRTLEDQPLLWIDKFVHFLYAVVAAQQFRENREMLSKDPLVKAFNYINIFVWIPGDLIALYIAGLHGPSDTYLKHMIGWGGYCLSTGTAMAYVNNDVWEDNAENSARRFIVARKGLTGHGIQIFQALLFAVLYIVSTGGSAVWGNRIEYIYDYAAHLYTGYGAL